MIESDGQIRGGAANLRIDEEMVLADVHVDRPRTGPVPHDCPDGCPLVPGADIQLVRADFEVFCEHRADRIRFRERLELGFAGSLGDLGS